MEKSRPSITVFFPAYNDGEIIGNLVLTSLNLLPQLTNDFEVIVVDDGSTDSTADVANRLANSYSAVKVVHHEKNRGYGAALRSGFTSAKKELVFYTDGDGQYDVRDLPELLSALGPHTDVVNGFKVQRSDSQSRQLLGGAYNRLARFLWKLPVRDVDCDFRLIRRGALDKIDLVSSSGTICVELVHKLQRAGCNFVEVPVRHYPRLYGRSQFFRPRPLAKTATELLWLWWRLIVWPRISSGSTKQRETGVLQHPPKRSPMRGAS